jgi:membrane-bound serine protease (ClpP class)
MHIVRLLWVIAAVLGGPAHAEAPAPVVALNVIGVIGPASAEYVQRGLARAAKAGAQLAVVTIDTPGGLDTSMRRIVQDVLASAVPVATFVAPAGARAASAGTFILYASHVAAMAPGTNVGAASPGAIGRTPPPTSAASRSCAAATPSGTRRPSPKRRACRRAKRRRRRSSTSSPATATTCCGSSTGARSPCQAARARSRSPARRRSLSIRTGTSACWRSSPTRASR